MRVSGEIGLGFLDEAVGTSPVENPQQVHIQAVLDAGTDRQCGIEFPDACKSLTRRRDGGEVALQCGFERRDAIAIKSDQIDLVKKNAAIGSALVQSRLQRGAERVGKGRVDCRLDVAAQLMGLVRRHICLNLLQLRGGIGTDSIEQKRKRIQIAYLRFDPTRYRQAGFKVVGPCEIYGQVDQAV